MNALQQLHPGRNADAMAWLQHDVLAVLHAPCAVGSAIKRAGPGHAGGHIAFSRRPETLRNIGVRAPGKREIALSPSEIEHGIAHGLFSGHQGTLGVRAAV